MIITNIIAGGWYVVGDFLLKAKSVVIDNNWVNVQCFGAIDLTEELFFNDDGEPFEFRQDTEVREATLRERQRLEFCIQQDTHHYADDDVIPYTNEENEYSLF